MKDNYSVAHDWAHSRDAVGHHLKSIDGKLFSYNTCIGKVVRIGSPCAYILDTFSYSVTTRKHQGYARSAIPFGATVLEFPFYHICESLSIQKPSYMMREILGHYYLALEKACKGVERSCSLRTERDFTLLSLWSKVLEADLFFAPVSNCTLLEHFSDKEFPVQAAFRATCKDGFIDTPSLSSVVDAALGEGSYLEYVCRTMPQRKCRATKNGIDFSLPSGITQEILENADIVLTDHLNALASARAIKEEEKKKKEERLQKDFARDKERFLEQGQSIYRRYPVAFFDGGNVLLRVDHAKNRIQTSKNVYLTFNEGKRLWGVVSKLHSGLNVPTGVADARTLNGDYKFISYKNDVLTIGCHSITFSEAQRIARELNFA